MHSNFDNLVLQDGIIYRKAYISAQERQQHVLPSALIEDALRRLHVEYPGRERNLSLIRDPFLSRHEHRR